MTKTIEHFTINDLAGFKNNFANDLIRYMYHLYWPLSFPLIHANILKIVNLYLQGLLESASYQENTYNEDVYRRTIEIAQHTRIYKASYSLNVHSAALKLESSISSDGSTLALEHRQ